MEIRKEMREAYYRALYGQLKSGGVNVPIYFDMVSKGLNPDTYCIISVSSNSSDDTIGTKTSEYVTQFTIVAKGSSNAQNATIDDIAGQFYQIVEPKKGVTGINPNGFQIVTTNKQFDQVNPSYESSTGAIVVERVIQIRNRIFHQ